VPRPQDDPGDATVTLVEPGPADGGQLFMARVGLLALIALLGWLVWSIVQPLWQPLAWAVLLGALLAPFNTRLGRRLGGRPQLASSLTLLGTVLLFILPVVAIAAAVAAQSAQLLRHLELHVPKSGQELQVELMGMPWLQQGLDWLQSHTGVTLGQLQGWLVGGSRKLLETLMSSGGSVLIGAVGTLTSFLLMLFVLFFVLRDGPRLARQLVLMLPIEERSRARLWRHLAEVTRAVFMGIGLTALAQGVLVGIGFAITGLPSPLVFGVVAAFVALIPMVGAALVWAPAAAVLALQGEHWQAVFLVAWGALVVGMADNFLRPLLISGRVEVPTLAVFVGVMGGLSAFGFIGLFIGPIVLGLLVALFRLQVELQSGAGGPGEE
jgi:predicted PurR-regulated permease PerM